jgi:predicted transcriptional regulator
MADKEINPITELRKACEKAGSQKAWAQSVGLSAPYVSDVIAGRREPGESILNALGLQRIVIYRKKG